MSAFAVGPGDVGTANAAAAQEIDFTFTDPKAIEKILIMFKPLSDKLIARFLVDDSIKVEKIYMKTTLTVSSTNPDTCKVDLKALNGEKILAEHSEYIEDWSCDLGPVGLLQLNSN